MLFEVTIDSTNDLQGDCCDIGGVEGLGIWHLLTTIVGLECSEGKNNACPFIFGNLKIIRRLIDKLFTGVWEVQYVEKVHTFVQDFP